MDSVPTRALTHCGECGRAIGQESHFCKYCGHVLPDEERKKVDELETALRRRPELPIIGGVFIIISSVFIFITIALVLHQRELSSQEWLGGLLSDWPDWYLGLIAIFGIVGMVGGVSALARRSQMLSVAGGILSCFGIGMVIGLIGLALVAASEDEFSSSLSDYTEHPGEIDSRALDGPGFGWRH